MTTETVQTAPATHRAEPYVTAVVILTIAFAVGLTWALPALMWLTVIGVRLAFIDAAVHRLPNRLVGAAYAGVTGLLLLPAIFDGMWWEYGRALIGGLVLFAVYFLLAVINPKGMGMGDVKLAAPLGTVLAWFNGALLIGFILGFLIGALVGIVLLVTKRADRNTKIAFGPSMLIGTWLAILVVTL